MGEAFICRRGGGGASGGIKSAIIGVKYPTGATVTVSNSTKTYTADETDGNTAFAVEAGTWTVKAVKGEDSKSVSVTVKDGDWASVELNFWDGTLYDAGDEYTNVTGGWEILKGTPTKGESSITVTGGANYTTYGVATSNKIDLTGFTQLRINMTAVSGGSGSFLAVVDAESFETIVGDNGYGGQAITAVASLETTSTGENTLDISSLASAAQTEYYIVYYINGTTNVSKTRTFDKVWLV